MRATYRCLHVPQRMFSTHSFRRISFAVGPSPPRLDPQEQEEFERLQKLSTGSFSTPRSPSSADFTVSPDSKTQTEQTSKPPTSVVGEGGSNAKVEVLGNGQDSHPDIRRGSKPEFQGERNPNTGEIGGPKNEPLRWGSTGERGDWSYNGRVTDF
ncbi:Succinate dehydrogenase assembly factor 4, mitochondrial [Golovinomyces cichoracearum]|uniref:Succinate dehydrogenase assembly factor 4, mitochondrial n=1 Tax=Golovinomyces cichoracearum TaxID=62708 RepID=A0A420ICY2_9PEZI|nr:Succinate dehydrogenase assembly factor 4, mitochondrial [Golovinomyces cichoracearum]